MKIILTIRHDRDYRITTTEVVAIRGGQNYINPRGWLMVGLNVQGKYHDMGMAWIGGS